MDEVVKITDVGPGIWNVSLARRIDAERRFASLSSYFLLYIRPVVILPSNDHIRLVLASDPDHTEVWMHILYMYEAAEHSVENSFRNMHHISGEIEGVTDGTSFHSIGQWRKGDIYYYASNHNFVPPPELLRKFVGSYLDSFE